MDNIYNTAIITQGDKIRFAHASKEKKDFSLLDNPIESRYTLFHLVTVGEKNIGINTISVILKADKPLFCYLNNVDKARAKYLELKQKENDYKIVHIQDSYWDMN